MWGRVRLAALVALLGAHYLWWPEPSTWWLLATMVLGTWVLVDLFGSLAEDRDG